MENHSGQLLRVVSRARDHHCLTDGFGATDADGGGCGGTSATLDGVLETLPVDAAADPLGEVGTSSARTGLGKIAALPDIGSAILRWLGPHAMKHAPRPTLIAPATTDTANGFARIPLA